MNVSRNVFGVFRSLSLVAVISAVCVLPAMAQMSAGTTQLSPAERAFVINMLQISQGQIALATLAEQRTNNPDARVAADRKIAHWWAFRAHLAMLAAAAGAPTTVALSADQQAMVAELQGTSPSRVAVVSARFAQQEDQTALQQIRAESSPAGSQVGQFIAYARPKVMEYEQQISLENWKGPTRTGSFAWK